MLSANLSKHRQLHMHTAVALETPEPFFQQAAHQVIIELLTHEPG
jgi:hypothetical protein